VFLTGHASCLKMPLSVENLADAQLESFAAMVMLIVWGFLETPPTL
jgi:hypothetical protein